MASENTCQSGSDRNTVETAYPGDVVGLVNANALAPGDTLYDGAKVQFPPIPSFAPEHFAVVRADSAGKYKQFRKGIEQLGTEGVVQLLRNDVRGDASPVMAAVGPMQFEVVVARMKTEFNVDVQVERLGYSVARRTDAAPGPAASMATASTTPPARCWPRLRGAATNWGQQANSRSTSWRSAAAIPIRSSGTGWTGWSIPGSSSSMAPAVRSACCLALGWMRPFRSPAGPA